VNCSADKLTRRVLIQRVSFLAAASRLVSAEEFRGPTLHHVSLQVSDLARSSEFYQRVFGCAAQNRDDGTILLPFEKGHLILRGGTPVGLVDHFAIGIDRFEQESVTRELKSHGANPSYDKVSAGLNVKDPDGIAVQLTSNATYTGKAAAFPGSSLDHLSIYTGDFKRSVEFYERIFRFTAMNREANPCLSSATPDPTCGAQLSVGTGHYITLRGGRTPAGIVDHFAIGIDGFDRESVIRDLKSRSAEPADDPVKGLHVKDPDGFAVQVIRNGNNGCH
jgi:catechol 2,3-dioxygenase-like lactoylglutathione lyase family enzyme